MNIITHHYQQMNVLLSSITLFRAEILNYMLLALSSRYEGDILYILVRLTRNKTIKAENMWSAKKS